MGASIVYGVGGPHGGWADMIKLDLHNRMYGEARLGEMHEVHIFAKPDATMDFVAAGCDAYVADYCRDGAKTVVVISVGMNNAKAIGTPDGYVSSAEDYEKAMRELLLHLASIVDAVVCVGFMPVDESKTSPKLNPFTYKNSYFTNQRVTKFNDAFHKAAEESGDKVRFIDLFGKVEQDDWIMTCLSSDGLHPNDKGHQWMYEQVMPTIAELAL